MMVVRTHLRRSGKSLDRRSSIFWGTLISFFLPISKVELETFRAKPSQSWGQVVAGLAFGPAIWDWPFANSLPAVNQEKHHANVHDKGQVVEGIPKQRPGQTSISSEAQQGQDFTQHDRDQGHALSHFDAIFNTAGSLWKYGPGRCHHMFCPTPFLLMLRLAAGGNQTLVPSTPGEELRMQQGLKIPIHRELLSGAPLIKGARRKPRIALLMHPALTMEGPWVQPWS